MKSKYYLEIFQKDVSKIANLPPYTGHLMVTGDTDIPLNSARRMRKWMRSFAKDFGYLNTSISTRTIKLDGFEGMLATLEADNGHMTVRIVESRGSNRVDFDIFFLSMINIDQALLEIVEDMELKTLDWYLFDRNDGINIVEDQDRFDSIKVKDE